MAPTIKPNEVVSADMAAYKSTSPKRWDVVVFQPTPVPEKEKDFWMMRVVGLPGETIEISEQGVNINGQSPSRPASLNEINYSPVSEIVKGKAVSFPFTIPDGTCFVLGDNVNNSFDSRFWGALPMDSIKGKIKNK